MNGIGDYTFVEELGRGNNGRYYLAEPPSRLRLDVRHVVVKVLDGATSSQAFRRATRELRAFAAVRSPYLVRLYDAGQQGSAFYYAMEHLPLGNLGSPRTPLSADDILGAVAHAARAAHALHEGGIAHRDITPVNVLLGPEGARLADLGLAQVLQPGVTATGLASVTSLEFLDPDVLLGGAATRQTDVYSLGMTLHRALTGQGAYGDLDERQPLLAVRRLLSSLPQLAPSLDDGAADLVRSCIDSDSSRRPRTALVVAERAEALVGRGGVTGGTSAGG